VATDTIKNVINVVARENLSLDSEEFCQAVAARFLELYLHVETVTVEGFETRWRRLSINGEPHPHSFVLDGNGRPFAKVHATRGESTVASGIAGFTFMKSTRSGWEGYHQDGFTTLAETRDRMCATAMEASWRWHRRPAGYAAANAKILERMLEVFATTYSASVQDSLYRMGMAALAAVPEILDIALACPNKHYLPIDLSRFGLTNENVVFLPTDEPHGQIECTVTRD
jgi:urate oxidase